MRLAEPLVQGGHLGRMGPGVVALLAVLLLCTGSAELPRGNGVLALIAAVGHDLLGHGQQHEEIR